MNFELKRRLIFVYGIACYLMFILTVLFAVGFIGNIGVSRSIDSTANMPVLPALGINMALLAVFALQHSGMARPAFKRWLTRYIPKSVERSTYVLLSSVCLGGLMWWWEPLGGAIWDVSGTTMETVMVSLYFSSWGFLFYATFLIDHFDLFGLKQVWCQLNNMDLPELGFVTPTLYRVIRHPIYAGWLGIMWIAPTMTITHLVFAAGITLYMVGGIHLEERDLANAHPEYRQYKAKVPALMPSVRRHLKSEARTQEV